MSTSSVVQYCRPSLPAWERVSADPLDAAPPTPEEWDWVVRNRPLVLKAVRAVRRSAFGAAHDGWEGDDLVSYLVPVLVRCLRNYDPARGALANAVYAYVWQALYPPRYARRGSVVGHRCRELVRPPDLLGDADDDVPDRVTEEDVDRALDARGDRERVGTLLEGLPSRERYVLVCRFGLEGCDPMTLLELSDELGVTRERVRQIEARALERVGRRALLQARR